MKIINKKYIEKFNKYLGDGNGNLLISGGKLISKRWNDGEYHYQDISDRAFAYLFDGVVIEDDFTIKDLILLLLKHDDFFAKLYEKEFFGEVIEYYRKIEKGLVANDEASIDVVELYWHLSSQQGEHFSDKELREEVETNVRRLRKPKYQVVDAHGNDFDGIFKRLNDERRKEIKKMLKENTYWEDVKRKYYFSGMGFPHCHVLCKEKGKFKPYSMSFIPLERLLSAKLRLSKVGHLVRDDVDPKNRKKSSSKFYNPSYTLGQVIQGFLWELSWYGSPEESKEKGEDLFKKAESVTKNKD